MHVEMDEIKTWAWDALCGLATLQELGLAHDQIHSGTLFIVQEDGKRHLKLGGWVLSYLTDRGRLVEFNLGNGRYQPPAGANGDLWALGTVFLELYLNKWPWSIENMDDSEAIELALTGDNLYKQFLADSSVDDGFKSFIQECFKSDSSIEAVQSLGWFDGQRPRHSIEKDVEKLTLQEAFHLWILSGGNVEAECAKQGSSWSVAPILTFPNILTEDQESTSDEILYSDTYYRLPVRHVIESLVITGLDLKTEKLPPQQVRERDPAYQKRRMQIFKKLLIQWPHSHQELLNEAQTDIAPFYRGRVWAAILGVDGDPQVRYDALDKETVTDTDKQLDLDIPRCHQYDNLLSSPIGQVQLRRVIKAWLRVETDLVYWQGLDSVAAAFVSVNFQDEALAFACFQRFVDKFLREFLSHDNNMELQRNVKSVMRLIKFHDAELAEYMQRIHLTPNLFAISWFMTMFAHLFTLEKIHHVYDKLLLAPSSLFLLFAVAIVLDMKVDLMQKEFNDCMLMFGDLAKMNVDKVLGKALLLLESTPDCVVRSDGEVGVIDKEHLTKDCVILGSCTEFSSGHIKDSIHIESLDVDVIDEATLQSLKTRLKENQTYVVTDPDLLTQLHSLSRVLLCTDDLSDLPSVLFISNAQFLGAGTG
jgi:hypothetical protein